MKSALASLFVVTILMVSSTTPVASQPINSAKIEDVKQLTTKIFINSNALLDDAVATSKQALAIADSGKKVTLTPVVNWLTYLQSLSAEAENAIMVGLNKGTVTAIEESIAIFGKAIDDTDKELDEYMRLLESNPGEPVDSMKTVVKKAMDPILAHAADNLNALKNLLPRDGDGNSSD